METFVVHNSTEPPELAPAVLVEYIARSDHPYEEGIYTDRVDAIRWHPSLEYRILRNPDGHPYVSAEGLEDWARWVVTVRSGLGYQVECLPTYSKKIDTWWFHGDRLPNLAPETHIYPGDWRDSLCEVWREE